MIAFSQHHHAVYGGDWARRSQAGTTEDIAFQTKPAANQGMATVFSITMRVALKLMRPESAGHSLCRANSPALILALRQFPLFGGLGRSPAKPSARRDLGV
jgi:hypothetical protein